jgi:hypothetical protein
MQKYRDDKMRAIMHLHGRFGLRTWSDVTKIVNWNDTQRHPYLLPQVQERSQSESTGT